MSLALHPSDLPAQDEALVAALRRPIGGGRGWGVVSTFILSVLSFGVLPLLAWPIRLRDLFAGEAARLIEITTFAIHGESSPTGGAGLLRAARQTGPRPMLWVLPLLCALLFVGLLVESVYGGSIRSLSDLVQLTYRADQSAGFNNPGDWARRVFTFWTAALAVGYLCHLIHVEVHFGSVRRFLVRFNSVLAMRGVKLIPLPRRTRVPNLFWLAGGAVLGGCFGAWWAVPMVIAGALQRRDAFAMHRDLRRALADRVNVLSVAHSLPEVRCPMPKCQAVIRPGSRFCPRCGSPVSPLSNAGGVWA